MKIEGAIVKRVISRELLNWSELSGAQLVLGNFAGWIDEVVIKNVHTADLPPSITLTSPVQGMVYAAPATISLTAAASDSDGNISKVEFFQGASLLGAVTPAPSALSSTALPAATNMST